MKISLKNNCKFLFWMFCASFQSMNAQQNNTSISRQSVSLNKNWKFFEQEIKLNKVSESDFIIVITIAFINEDEDFAYKNQIYYYDDESFVPVPLKEFTIQKRGTKYFSTNEKSLWKGDYNNYMKVFFNLETKMRDTLE